MFQKLIAIVTICLWPLAAHATADITTIEKGFDRPGAEFMSAPVPTLDHCRTLCFDHGSVDLSAAQRCLAYTFRASTKMCSLKNATPAPVPDADAVSGLHVIVKFGDNGVSYPENNIRGADFDTRNPVECQDKCRGDKSCRAWTWMKPGMETVSGHCHLKDSVPLGKRDNCCVSGWGKPP